MNDTSILESGFDAVLPSLTFNAIDAKSKRPIRNLTVTVTAQGPDDFQSEQTLRTGQRSEVSIPVTDHLKSGFRIAIFAKGYKPHKLAWNIGQITTVSREASIPLPRKFSGRK